jgi:hypothetical protein
MWMSVGIAVSISSYRSAANEVLSENNNSARVGPIPMDIVVVPPIDLGYIVRVTPLVFSRLF